MPAAWGLTMAATTPLTHAADLKAFHLTPTPTERQHPGSWKPPPRRPRPTPNTGPASGPAPAPPATTPSPTSPSTRRAPPTSGASSSPSEGEAVPDLNATTLAGIFDLPVGTVTLLPHRRLRARPQTPQARPTLEHAAQAVQTAPSSASGTEKIAHPERRRPRHAIGHLPTEPNRIALRVTAPDDQMIQLNQKQIARAVGYKDLTLVMVETDGLGDGLISIYKEHPLLNVREATIEDLTMQPDGTIALGQQPDGRIGRVPLYDPQMGAITDLYVGAPGAGKSVTLLHILAAERISGIVSIVADAQDGMSLPEVDGRVYHFGKGIAATAATIAASVDLGKYREKISAKNGWGSFEIGSPWPLVNITADELNRILSSDAVVPRPFRKWVTGLVGDSQSTGRKLGEGMRFAAQSIHLADLGDKDRIRANAKNGTVWLGRTNSSTTQHMARDGVLPPGVELAPIPRYFGTGAATPSTPPSTARKPSTARSPQAWPTSSTAAASTSNRTWFARKENKTYPGLIALMESAPIPRLTPDEDLIFQTAYAKWLAFAETLLAEGDTAEGIAQAGTTYRPPPRSSSPPSASTTRTKTTTSRPGSIKDRILDLLADRPHGPQGRPPRT
jgi:hypothetical protein